MGYKPIGTFSRTGWLLEVGVGGRLSGEGGKVRERDVVGIVGTYGSPRTS